MVSRKEVPRGCRLLWSVAIDELASPPLPPSGPIEVRWEIRVPGDWDQGGRVLAGAALPGPWGLWLEGLVEKENDDLAALFALFEVARAGGCASVALAGPEGDYAYRYRLVSLIRYLCEDLKLRFGVVELRERPVSDYLNRYFASAKCCRSCPGKKLGPERP